MRIGSLCSGYGGLDLAVEAVFPDATPAWFVEYDRDPSRILAHHWPDVPNHGDVKLTDWRTVEPVDILTAGYPCQPFSHAGKRKGADDPRHLWPDVARAIGALRPGLVVLENVRGHVSLGLADVLGDLSGLGYDATWGVVRAADAGAPHGRARIFIVATDADGGQREGWGTLSAGSAGDRPRRIWRPKGAGSGTDADADSLGRTRLGAARRRGTGPADGDHAPADPYDYRRDRGWNNPGRPVITEPVNPGTSPRRWDAKAHGEAPRTTPERLRVLPSGRTDEASVRTNFGVYQAAVERWAHTIGRPAPAPTEPGRNGPRLSPTFVEWMMGLPAGHVTGVPDLSRNAQLKALGNGVVPQQATLALRTLLPLAVSAA